MSSIFRKDIERRCEYCALGDVLRGSDVMCRKHGLVGASGSCRSFKYDAQKRVPARPVSLKRDFKEDDFKI